MSEIIFI